MSNSYTTRYIRERVRDIRFSMPANGVSSDLETAIMAAIGYTAVKLRFNRFASVYCKSHPDAYARATGESLLDTDDMVRLYQTMMSWSKVEPTMTSMSEEDINKQIPIPKTRDVYRYLYVLHFKEERNLRKEDDNI